MLMTSMIVGCVVCVAMIVINAKRLQEESRQSLVKVPVPVKSTRKR